MTKNYSAKGFTGAYVSGYTDAMAKVRSVLAKAIVSERKCRDTARKHALNYYKHPSTAEVMNDRADSFDSKARDLLSLALVATDND